MSDTKQEFFKDFFRGDRRLWWTVIGMSIISLAPVYSAISNLSFVAGKGSTTGLFLKHFIFVVLGVILCRCMMLIRYQYLGKLSALGVVIMIILLFITALTGGNSNGASAARWLLIPGTNFGFQPSTFAFLVLVVYLCRYLHKHHEKEKSIWQHILLVFTPMLIIFGLVFKENGSTGIIILFCCSSILFIGSFPKKALSGFIGFTAFLTAIYVFLCLFTSVIPERHNRVRTQLNRFKAVSMSSEVSKNNALGKNTLLLSKEDSMKAEEKFSKLNDKEYVKTNIQRLTAKAAIVNGGYTGRGPGKSALKQRLPQVENDFIFSIIVEEYGVIGALFTLFCYFMIFNRIYNISKKIANFYASLLVLSIGIMFFCQIVVNISVSLNIIPVTGQPLPFFSYGGTSILAAYIQVGIILNISTQIQTRDEIGLNSNQKMENIYEIA